MPNQTNALRKDARWQIIIAIYLSGFLNGITLIIFPAAGPLFTDAAFHNLSSSQFGNIFLPQLFAAIISSSLASQLGNKLGMKRVLMLGLGFHILAMLLLASTQLSIGLEQASFFILLAATASVGLGFGFSLSALNAYAFNLFPGKEDSAVTGLHVLTGVGQAGAALMLKIFLDYGLWWGAPILIASLLFLMIIFQSTLNLQLNIGQMPKLGRIPALVWFYAIIAFAYGGLEMIFSNWSAIYLESEASLTMTQAALGLSLFWIAVTSGRFIFAVLAVRFNLKLLYYLTPIVLVITLFMLPTFKGTGINLALMAFSGLAISFYFPYTISLAASAYPKQTAVISGLLVASLQLGFGIGASLTGWANESISLGTIFQASSFWPLLILIFALIIGFSTRMQPCKQLPPMVLPCPQTETKALPEPT